MKESSPEKSNKVKQTMSSAEKMLKAGKMPKVERSVKVGIEGGGGKSLNPLPKPNLAEKKQSRKMKRKIQNGGSSSGNGDVSTPLKKRTKVVIQSDPGTPLTPILAGKKKRYHRSRRGKKRRNRSHSSVGGSAKDVPSSKKSLSRTPSSLMKERGPNVAPFNTTQFIMNDHGETIQYLDRQLGVAPDDYRHNPQAGHQRLGRPRTARESSFSLGGDEEDNYYYSSPADEEDFVNKEFLKDYNDVRADRLVGMGKGELISEYMQMEAKIEALERRLRRRTHQFLGLQREHQQQQDQLPSTTTNENKSRAFYQRTIRSLEAENARLRLDNVELRRANRRLTSSASAEPSVPEAQNDEAVEDVNNDVSSTDDSSSSGSSSSGSSTSGSDTEDDERHEEEVEQPHKEEEVFEDPPVNGGQAKAVDAAGADTGYESGQSKENAAEVPEAVSKENGERQPEAVNEENGDGGLLPETVNGENGDETTTERVNEESKE